MRRLLTPVLVAVLVAVSCGDDGATTAAPQPPSTVPEKTTSTSVGPTTTMRPTTTTTTLEAAPPTTSPRPTVPAPTEGPRWVGVGEVGISHGVEVVVSGYEFYVCDSDPTAHPAPGNTLVGLDVRLTNRDYNANVPYGGLAWEMFDSSGRRYGVRAILPCREGPHDGFLGPGVTVNAYLEFEVPADASGLVAQWDGLGDEYAVDIVLGE